MNLTLLQSLAADNSWGSIRPELMLGCLALSLLVLDLALPKRAAAAVALVFVLGQAAVLADVLLHCFDDILRQSVVP